MKLNKNMKRVVKALIGFGAVGGAVYVYVKADKKHRKKHDGQSIAEHVGHIVETHPTACAVMSVATAVTVGTIAGTYKETHMPEEYWKAKQEDSIQATKRYEARLEAEHRHELERLQQERDMPNSYWSYKAALEDHQAAREDRISRENIAKADANARVLMTSAIADVGKRISDNSVKVKQVEITAKKED